VLHVDAGEALDELSRLSAEIRSAAIVDSTGTAVAQMPGVDGERLARTASELLDVAGVVDPARAVDRVEVSLASRTVFVVRSGGHAAIATTPPETPAALVVHDLRTCLARIDA
jgi:predicted regulator of Ras-like GTPase activity (Roadblock/LC7/MglB family)